MKQELSIFAQSIQDFFTPKMLKYALMPFIVTLVLMYILFFVFAGIGIEHLGSLQIDTNQTTVQNGVQNTQTLSAQLEGFSIIKFLMSYTVTSWAVTLLFYLVGSFLTLLGSLFIALIIIGLLTPFIIKELHKRHYSDLEMVGFSNIFEAIYLILKWTLLMLLLFILLIPFYFIPFVNIVALNFPLYFFFHKLIIYDVGSCISSREEFRFTKYTHPNLFRLKTLGLYLVSMIPFAIFFGAIFYVIYLGHTYFRIIIKIRKTNT